MKLPAGDQIPDDARYPGNHRHRLVPRFLGGSIVRCSPGVSFRGRHWIATTNKLPSDRHPLPWLPVLVVPRPVLCRDADHLPIGSQWAYQLKVDHSIPMPPDAQHSLHGMGVPFSLRHWILD